MTTRTTPTDTSTHVLTVDEAAKLLRISRGLAFNAVHTGAIPHLRIGRRILIPRAALSDLIGIGPRDETDGQALGYSGEADENGSNRRTTESESSARGSDQGDLQDLAARLQAIVDSRQPETRPSRRGTGSRRRP